MTCIKHNVANIFKLILNHVVSSVYSLVLLLIFYKLSEGRFLYVGSLISILFYLGLIYSLMWQAGAKDKNSFYHADVKSYHGFILIAVACIPTIITNLISSVASLFSREVEFAERTVDLIYPIFYYINYLFTQCMYSGLFITINGDASTISPWWFLLSIIPAIIVGGIAYNFGFRAYRLRTLFGIKYDEEKEKVKNNY